MASLKRNFGRDVAGGNISSKIFVRSTKNNKAQKIVRELYLRRDIPCSSKLCDACAANAPADANGQVQSFVLSERPAGTKEYPQGHYLMPDTNAFLNAMDLFEHASAFYDVIILQTVLEELKNRSIPLYNRVLGLTKSAEKRFYVFFNEFRQETYVLRDKGESINDRNDRAVRQAAKWYGDHVQSAVQSFRKGWHCPAIVILTDDKDIQTKSKRDGLYASSLSHYLSQLDNADQLLDMLAGASSRDQSFRTTTGEMIYPEYYSMSKLNTGVKGGTLHQGIFNVSSHNYLEASVHVPAFERDLIIQGRENGNRAVSGDVVVVEVLPKSEWKIPSNQTLEEEAIEKDENADEENVESIISEQERRALQLEARLAQNKNFEGRAQPTARVVGVVKRNWRQYVGHVDGSSRSMAKHGRRQQNILLIPMDKRIPKIKLRTRQADELVGKRIVVTIDSWDRDSRHPIGHFVRSLGELETKEAETEALLLEYDVQYRPFPQAVLDCLPAEGHGWRVPADTSDPGWIGRRDLRELLICSIDPVGCKDIDDALHARPLSDGNIEVGVHIADVSHFVKPNTAMDEEASMRGTTVYLVDKRIDMLPMLLGTDLCSLKPYVERFAFSTIWKIDQNANILDVVFTKSVIRSREAFSYEQAQLRIDDRSQTDDLTQGMRTLMMLSKKLKQRRLDNGALNLASPEVRVEMESETSDPMDVKTKQHLDTNSLVEEFMLLANISVAGKIYTTFPQSALLRRHAAPPKTNFEELANQLKVRKGLELQSSSSKELADSLDTCTDPNVPFFNTLVRILATRCMMSAEYFVSGTQSYPEFRHYGLASEIYTHFTSPIRRYADLVAHRQLAAAIEYEGIHPSLRSKGKLEGVCKNINIRHRNAQFAGRASVEYYVGQALKGRVVEEDGFVMKIFANGFVVFVPRFGIEGTIRLRDIATPEPVAEFDAETYELNISGSRSAHIALFDKIKVKITDVLEQSTNKRKLRMDLL